MTASNRPQPSPTTDSCLPALLARHGELMTGPELVSALRFGSARSFRRAAAGGHLPIPVTRVQGRQGWFARTRDVAEWFDRLGRDEPAGLP